MVIKCLIKEKRVYNGQEYYFVESIDSDQGFVVPVSNFKYFDIDFNVPYDFWLNKTPKKDYISLVNPEYLNYESYYLQIKEFSFLNIKGKEIPTVVVDVSGVDVHVFALQWHTKEIWPFKDLRCQVRGYNMFGVPKLILNDDRHPIFSQDGEYPFEVVNFSTKLKEGTKDVLRIIDLRDKLGGNHTIPLFPNQENKLKIGDTIICKVVAINTRLRLKQVNVDDPFFYSFEEVESNSVYKSKYFLPYFVEKEATDYSTYFVEQYESKSAFWVFTYCNNLLPKLFYSALERKDYLRALEINTLWLKIEKWILKIGILRAFSNEEDRKITKKKIENVLLKLEVREKLLQKIDFWDLTSFINSFSSIKSIYFYEFFSIVDFQNIKEADFLDLIELISKSGLKDEDVYMFKKLADLIEYKKRFLVIDVKEDYFVSVRKLALDQELALKRYILWTYSQSLLYKLTNEKQQYNITCSRVLRLLVYFANNMVDKETLLFNSFYLLSNNDLNYKIPFERKDIDLCVSFDKLNKNPNLGKNELTLSKFVVDSTMVRKVKVIKRHYQGFIVDLHGIIGFLPIQNITDNNLKRYPFEGILNWEINVNIHLFSDDFNFFVAKQIPQGNKNYYSKNLITSPVEGDVIQTKIAAIENYGVFLFSPYGDGLLHINNIKDGLVWNKESLSKVFLVGSSLPVCFLKKEGSRLNFGFKQLLNTTHREFYLSYFDSQIEYDLDYGDSLLKQDISRELEIEKGYIFEQFAVLQELFENKIKYIRFAKQFFANTENARSYLLNIYIDYFTALIDLDALLQNYSSERYDEFRKEILKIKVSIDEKTLNKFSESENLIFFVDILSFFNVNSEDADNELMNYIKKYSSGNGSSHLLSVLAKNTLANNLLISEIQRSDSNEGVDFSLRNLRRIRDYIKSGIFSLSESEIDRIGKELKEKVKYWSGKIKLDEGECLEFKSTLITPVPSKDKLAEIEKLEKKFNSETDSNAKKGLKKSIQDKKDDLFGEKAKKRIIHSAFKTIAAFANTNGGELLIGVTDNKEIFGLETDYDSFDKTEEKCRDGFGKFFDAKIKDYFGDSFSSTLLEKEFLKFPQGDILIVKVKPCKEEVFLLKDELGEPKEGLYIRNLSSTEKLEGRELAKFIRNKFREQLK